MIKTALLMMSVATALSGTPGNYPLQEEILTESVESVEEVESIESVESVESIEEVESVEEAESVEEIEETVGGSSEEFSAKETLHSWLENYFSPETVASIISALTTIAVVLELVKSLKKLGKEKTMTMNDVTNAVVDVLKKTNKEAIDDAIQKFVEPMQKQLDQIVPVLNTFTKVLALSQENTPESRVAIVNLIETMGTEIGKSAAALSKNVLLKQIEEDKVFKAEQDAKLDAIIAKNENTKKIGEGRY